MLDKQPYGKGFEQKNKYHLGLPLVSRKEGRVPIHEHIIFGYVIPPFLPICHPFRPLFIYRELLQTRRLISLQNPGHYLGGPYKDELKGEVIISPLSIYPSISSNWVTEYRSFCRKSSSLLPFSICSQALIVGDSRLSDKVSINPIPIRRSKFFIQIPPMDWWKI